MIAGILEIQLMANMARLSDDMRRAEQVVTGSMTKVEKSVASAKTAMSQLGMGVSLGLMADTLRRTVDSYTKLDAQLRLSTKSQEQYNQALSDIRTISTVAQSDISATTMLYTRLMNVMDGTGVSQEKLNLVTQTVSFGLKAYGATAQEAASASLQLSQAMGANRLGGEEFRAVMEAMPNVMKVLAKSMNVPLGELRALSIAGKITADEMVKAWGNPEIAAQFRQMAESAQTVTGAWTVARNELMLLVGEFSKSSGITGSFITIFNALAGLIRITAKYVDDLAVAFGIWAAIAGGKLLASLASAYLAQIALNKAHGEALIQNVALAKTRLALANANMTLATSTAELAAAQKLLDAGTITTWGKIKGLVGKAGIWGMILWGVYELADAMGLVDKLFDKLDKRASEQAFKSVGDINKAIAATEKQLATQKELEKSRGGVGGALAGAYDVSMGGSSADIAQRLRDLKLLREEEKKKLAANFADAEDRVSKERDVTGLIFETQKAAKAHEIKELQDKTDKVLSSKKFSAEQMLSLEEQYNAKLADINKKYADKDKVKRDEFLIDQTARLESILAVEKSVAQQEQEAWDKATTGKKVSYAALQEHLKVMDAARAADQIKRAGDAEKAIAEQSKALQAQRAESAGIRAETAGIAGQNALFGLTGDARIAAELEQAKKAEDLRYEADLLAQARRIQTMIDENTWKQDTATQQAVIMEDLERQHQERLLNIQRQHLTKSQQQELLNLEFSKKTAMEKTAYLSGMLMEMTASAAQHNRAMFEINKVAATANAIVKGIEAVQSAYAFGSSWGGPIGGGVMAAIAAVATAANVAAIQSTTFGSGAAGAASSASAGVPSAAGVLPATAPTVTPTAPTAMPAVTAPPREVNIYMRGDEVYGAKAVREQLIPALNDALGDGVVINVRQL